MGQANIKALIDASCQNKTEEVSRLLSFKVDVNCCDEDGCTALHSASMNGNSEVIRLLLDAKADPTLKNYEGDTPLILATVNSHESAMKQLTVSVDAAASISNEADSQGFTPLHYVAQMGNMAMASHLLSHCKADLHIGNADGGLFPIHVAVLHGRVDMVKLFTSHDKTIVLQRDSNGDTPLHYACLLPECNKMVDALLQANAPVKAINASGQTAAEKAILVTNGAFGNNRMAISLLEQAADRQLLARLKAEAEALKNLTIEGFFMAISKKNLDEATRYLERGFDINKQNSEGSTALHIACYLGHLGAVQLLLDNKAHPSIQNFAKSSPLVIAAYANEHEIVGLLLQKRANVNSQDNRGNTALHFAAGHGNRILTSLLLHNYRALPTIRNSNGFHPLCTAVIKNQRKVASLIARSAPETLCLQTSTDGNTALHLACSLNTEQQEPMIKSLLRYKASVLIKNNKDHNVLDVALLKQCTTTVINLLQKTAHLEVSLEEEGSGGMKGPMRDVANLPNKDELRIACEEGDAAKVEQLIKDGLVHDLIFGEEELCPIHIASVNNRLQVVRVLVSVGADMNITDAKGRTALGCCKSGEIGAFLVVAGADIGLLDDERNSCLHNAAKIGSLELVKLLLEHGANPCIRNNVGFTALGIVLVEWARISTLMKTKDDETGGNLLAELEKNEAIVEVLDEAEVHGEEETFDEKSLSPLQRQSLRDVQQLKLQLRQVREAMKRKQKVKAPETKSDDFLFSLLQSDKEVLQHAESDHCLGEKQEVVVVGEDEIEKVKSEEKEENDEDEDEDENAVQPDSNNDNPTVDFSVEIEQETTQFSEPNEEKTETETAAVVVETVQEEALLQEEPTQIDSEHLSQQEEEQEEQDYEIVAPIEPVAVINMMEEEQEQELPQNLTIDIPPEPAITEDANSDSSSLGEFLPPPELPTNILTPEMEAEFQLMMQEIEQLRATVAQQSETIVDLQKQQKQAHAAKSGPQKSKLKADQASMGSADEDAMLRRLVETVFLAAKQRRPEQMISQRNRFGNSFPPSEIRGPLPDPPPGISPYDAQDFLEFHAATRIATAYKGHMGRQWWRDRFRGEEASATMIQLAAKAHFARLVFKEKLVLMLKKKRFQAVMFLKRVWYRHNGRVIWREITKKQKEKWGISSIQRVYRGHVGRLQYRNRKALLEEESEAHLLAMAQRKIQRREHRVKMRAKKRQERINKEMETGWIAAATRVQSVVRGHRSRRMIRLWEAFQKATVLQSAWKAHAARAYIRNCVGEFKKNAAILRIQTAIRSNFARKELLAKVSSSASVSYDRMANKLHLEYKLHRVRAFIHSDRDRRLAERIGRAKIILYFAFAFYLAKRNKRRAIWLARRYRCASKVQSVFRAHLTRRIYSVLLARKTEKMWNDEASKIQKEARGYLVRRSLEDLGFAATKIKAIYRGHMARSSQAGHIRILTNNWQKQLDQELQKVSNFGKALRKANASFAMLFKMIHVELFPVGMRVLLTGAEEMEHLSMQITKKYTEILHRNQEQTSEQMWIQEELAAFAKPLIESETSLIMATKITSFNLPKLYKKSCGISVICNKIAMTLMTRKQYEMAAFFLDEALKLCDGPISATSRQAIPSWTRANLAVCYRHLGKWQEGVDLIQHIISKTEEREDLMPITTCALLLLASFMSDRFRHKQALELLNQASQILQQMNPLDSWTGFCSNRFDEPKAFGSTNWRQLAITCEHNTCVHRMAVGAYRDAIRSMERALDLAKNAYLPTWMRSRLRTTEIVVKTLAELNGFDTFSIDVSYIWALPDEVERTAGSIPLGQYRPDEFGTTRTIQGVLIDDMVKDMDRELLDRITKEVGVQQTTNKLQDPLQVAVGSPIRLLKPRAAPMTDSSVPPKYARLQEKFVKMNRVRPRSAGDLTSCTISPFSISSRDWMETPNCTDIVPPQIPPAQVWFSYFPIQPPGPMDHFQPAQKKQNRQRMLGINYRDDGPDFSARAAAYVGSLLKNDRIYDTAWVSSVHAACWALNQRAMLDLERDQLEEAFDVLRLCETLCLEPLKETVEGIQNRAWLADSMARYLMIFGEAAVSLLQLKKALSQAGVSQFPSVMIVLTMHLAVAASQLGKHGAAIESLLQAWRMLKNSAVDSSLWCSFSTATQEGRMVTLTPSFVGSAIQHNLAVEYTELGMDTEAVKASKIALDLANGDWKWREGSENKTNLNSNSNFTQFSSTLLRSREYSPRSPNLRSLDNSPPPSLPSLSPEPQLQQQQQQPMHGFRPRLLRPDSRPQSPSGPGDMTLIANSTGSNRSISALVKTPNERRSSLTNQHVRFQ